MKISIITPAYNSVATIERTIISVLNQKDVDLEYIIIDGGSTDGTLDVIDKYKDKITRVISESDKGLYDAMNKGIGFATGDIVGILNSDDFFSNESVLASVIAGFENSDAGSCYGDISYFNNDDKKTTRLWRAGEYSEKKLANGWVMPHPALFVKKSIYDSIGLYRTDLKLAADYEFMLRLLKIHKIKVKYLPKVLTRMQAGGVSGRNLKYRLRGWRELKKSWELNNLQLPRFFVFRRVFFKINQILFR